MRRRTYPTKNLLAHLGTPFFHLIIYTITFLASLLLILVSLSHRLKKIKFSLSSIIFFDSLVTSILSSIYLKKDKKRHQKKAVKITLKAKLGKVSLHLPKIGLSEILLFTIIASFTWFFYVNVLADLPSPYSLTNRPRKLTTQILDRNGRLLFKIYQDENRTPIKLETLPNYVKKAFLAIEDNGFYTHSGFRLTAVLRALYHNLFKSRSEGGSTITQQLVKNALLSPEKTWQRKAKELILAVAVESIFDKDIILEMYLNEVGFGGPAYGIQEASQQYFDRNAADLTLPEAAFLAGLPKAPSKYSPYISPDLAKSRQNLVLNLMLKAGYITQDQFTKAVSTPLEFAPPKIEIKAPHFVMFVRDLLVDQYGEELVSHGGLKVTTTLDLDLQDKAETYLNEELKKIALLNVNNGSVLITRPSSGEILAMVGSKNYFDIKNDGQVNLTTALRQPGSSIKVVNYALAFENGASPNTSVKDEPISFNIEGSGIWTPKNYDNRFHGTQTIRSALANSYNIPAVLMLAKNGVRNMIALGQRLGITTWNDPNRYGLALTLGGAAVKMTEMAVVYGTLANGGLTVPLNPIVGIENPSGRKLKFDVCLTHASPCASKQTLKKETAFFLSDILSDNNARAAAFGFHSVLNISPFKAAVKTGTSNDLRDNWTFGYTPDFLVATWVGNNNNSPMSRVTSGITGASPIWAKIMKDLLQDNPNNNPFPTPDNLIQVPICTLTGTLTCNGCPTRLEYFVKGSEPKVRCKEEEVQKIKEQKQANPTGNILDGASTQRNKNIFRDPLQKT